MMDQQGEPGTVVDASNLPMDTIRAVSDRVCVVRVSSGVYAFDRRCPHAGADLANGYVDAGKVRCAWHNLPYDPVDGSQPCRSLQDLRVYPLTPLEGQRYRMEPGP